MKIPIDVNDKIPPDTIVFMSARKWGVDFRHGQLVLLLEPEEEWAKRCAVISNVVLNHNPLN